MMTDDELRQMPEWEAVLKRMRGMTEAGTASYIREMRQLDAAALLAYGQAVGWKAAETKVRPLSIACECGEVIVIPLPPDRVTCVGCGALYYLTQSKWASHSVAAPTPQEQEDA